MRARPVVRSSARPRHGLWRIDPALDRRSAQPPSRTRVRALWKRTSSVMAQAVGSPGGAGAGSTGAEVGDLRVEDVGDQAGPPGVAGGGLASHPRRGPQDRSSHPTGQGPNRALTGGLWYRPFDDRHLDGARSLGVGHVVPLTEVLNGCRTKRPPSSSPRSDRRRTEFDATVGRLRRGRRCLLPLPEGEQDVIFRQTCVVDQQGGQGCGDPGRQRWKQVQDRSVQGSGSGR